MDFFAIHVHISERLCNFACMKLTIIIPVYRTASTLDRCLESVVSQSFRDIQVILVDDASPDECPALCDVWTQRDHRIQVIHRQRNGGLSAARNAGLAKARGEYVTFIDSDDTLAPDTYSELFQVLTIHPDYDLLEYPVYEHYGNPRRQRILRFGQSRSYQDWKEYWLREEGYRHCYAVNKVYRKELFKDLSFPEGKKFEDVWLMPSILRRCRTIATTSVGLYYYYDNPSGITHTTDAKAQKDLLDASLLHLSLVEDAAAYLAVVNIALDYYDLSGHTVTLPPCRYTHHWKLRIIKLFGFNTLCLLSHTLHLLIFKTRLKK